MATLLLFGRLAEQAGWRSKAFPLPTELSTVARLRAHLAQDIPEIAAASARAAVNKMLARDDDPITDQDEIAFMPPMSGG